MTTAQGKHGIVVEAHPQVGFRPYVLWRRGTLAFDDLRVVSMAQTWSAVDALEAGQLAHRGVAERLSERLHGFVPGLDDDGRRLIIRLRRDLHNGRRLAPCGVSLAQTLLGPDDAAALSEWSEARELREISSAQLEAVYERELEVARRRISEIAGSEEFLKGVQLSGLRLFRSVLGYVESTQGTSSRSRDKRARKTESTVVRYAYRMALRTTPFASFTEIGAQPWRVAPTPPAPHGSKRRRIVRLNRGLLVWMASVLGSVEGAERSLRLRLNNTIERGEVVAAFTRGMDGDGRSCWNERFVSLPESKPLALVIDKLQQGAVPRVQIVELLTGLSLPADRVNAFLDKLVDVGLLHQDFDLPDQIGDYARAVAARIAEAGSPQAQQCAEIFTTLADLETGFGAAPAAQRVELMGRISQEIERFTEICGVSSPAAISESPVWEDVGACGEARCWDPTLLERNHAHFSRLQQLVPLFDDMVPQRLGLYRWFTSRFGEDGRCDDLLRVYREFASQTPAQISAVMQALDDPRASTIVELRGRFLRRVYASLEASGDVSTLSIDEEIFDDLFREYAPWVPRWASAAYWLQLVPEASGQPASIVVNNVATGHGVFFSRFCDLVEPDDGGWTLAAALRGATLRESPRQADLTAVFGINVNLHPNLSPLEVVYPGSVATTDRALTIRDLGIRADRSTCSLQLYTRADGTPIDIVPLNFLFPAAAPMLYRFLCTLGTSHNMRMRIWDRLRWTMAAHRTEFPQLRFGELVLERRTWFISSQELAFLGDGTRLPDLELLRRAEAWRRDRELPREAFIRGADRAAQAQHSEHWADVTRQWALEARSARRKPQYLDFHNPFLLRILAKIVRTSSGGGVFFSECLPPTSLYGGVGGATAAEEFLVEFSSTDDAEPRR